MEQASQNPYLESTEMLRVGPGWELVKATPNIWELKLFRTELWGEINLIHVQTNQQLVANIWL